MSRRILQKTQVAAQRNTASVPPLMTDDKYGSVTDIMSFAPARLVEIVRDESASVYAKAKACNRLAVVGDASAVPALAALLGHPQLSTYARFALEPLPDAAVDDSLRAALPKLQGNLLIGVINSIGNRRDRNAIDALAKLRKDADPEVANAAGAALARIRPA